MKNFIIYFYNIIPTTIKFGKNGYTFSDGNSNYYLKENTRTREELNELYDLSYYARSFGLQFHKIIPNIYGDILTYISNKEYILLEILINENKCIELKDLELLFNFQVDKKYKYILRNNWSKFWTERVDYIELKISEYKDINKKIISCIDYNIGLMEIAVQLLLEVQNNEKVINHIRIKKNMTLLEFYDPSNLVLDTKSRNLCEYYRNIIDNDITSVIKIDLSNLNINEKKLFFIRFLYNTTFFDLLSLLDTEGETKRSEKILSKINKQIENIEINEEIIKKIYDKKFKNYFSIEWLKKTS